MKYNITYIDILGDEHNVWLDATSKGDAIRETKRKYANAFSILKARRTAMVGCQHLPKSNK